MLPLQLFDALPFLYALASFYRHFPELKAMGGFWDLKATLLTAMWITGKKLFFHPGAYPLPVLVFVWLLASFKSLELSVLFYFLISAFVFYVAVKMLSKKLNIPQEVLFISFFSLYFIYYALGEGTELLYLSFMLLAFAFFPGMEAAVFLTLTGLTRYYSFVFGALLLFFEALREKRLGDFIRILIISAVFSGILIALYSWLFLGNPTAQFVEYLKGNFIYRLQLLPMKAPWEDLWTAMFLVSGLFLPQIFFVSWRKFLHSLKENVLLVFSFSLALLIPKVFTLRYLFPLTLPLALSFAKSLKKEALGKAKLFSLATIFLTAFLRPYTFTPPFSLQDCFCLSNYWVEVAFYFKKPCMPLAWPGWENLTGFFLSHNITLVALGKSCGELSPPPEIFGTCRKFGNFAILIPRVCLKPRAIKITSVEWREKGLEILKRLSASP